MNNRLQQFLGAENISQSQFAEELGVARASVSHILAGRNKPGYDFLTSLMARYPRLNMEWLLAGKGKMYKENSQTEERPVQETTPAPDLFTSLPESPISMPEPVPEANPALTDAPTAPSVTSETTDNQKTITKIIVFYSDHTFQEIR